MPPTVEVALVTLMLRPPAPPTVVVASAVATCVAPTLTEPPAVMVVPSPTNAWTSLVTDAVALIPFAVTSPPDPVTPVAVAVWVPDAVTATVLPVVVMTVADDPLRRPMNASTSELTRAVALPPAPPPREIDTATTLASATSVAVAATVSEPALTSAPPPTHARVPIASAPVGSIVAVAKNALMAIAPAEPPWASAVAVAVPLAATAAAPPTVTMAPAPTKASRLPLIRAVELLPAPPARLTDPTIDLAVAVRSAGLTAPPATPTISTVSVPAWTTAPAPMNARVEPST